MLALDQLHLTGYRPTHLSAKDSAPAIAFYTRLGCELADRGGNWICRLNREQLRQLSTTDVPPRRQETCRLG